jgi:hypothetical protein
MAAREGLTVRRLDRRSIEQHARAHCDRWRELLSGGDVQEGRGLLREVLEESAEKSRLTHERTASPEMTFSEGTTRAGLQLALESNSSLLVAECDDHIDAPWPSGHRVATSALVVISEPGPQIRGHARVVECAVVTPQDVHEPFCGHEQYRQAT